MSTPGSSGYTVTLELPECATDWEADGNVGPPTPIDAVVSFQRQMTGNPDHWVYAVEDNATHQKFLVDMAEGPSVSEVQQ